MTDLPHAEAAVAPLPPERMSYQGYLVDGNNVPLGDAAPANYDATFRIYNVSSGGTALWAEQQTITVDKGYFSVLLGEGGSVPGQATGPLSEKVFSSGSSDRFIGITVKGLPADAGIEIAPRIQLLSSPYAFSSKFAGLSEQARQVVGTNGAAMVSAVTVSGQNRVGIHNANPSYPLDVTGDVRASGIFRGNGSQLTSLNAANISSGALSQDRLGPLEASKITSGQLDPARLPSSVVQTVVSNTFTAGQRISGVLRADILLGQGTVPIGGIIMWSGIDRDLNGSGWALCNGQPITLQMEDGRSLTVNTPNLTERFIMGASGLTAASGVGQIGGGTATLSVANLPPHGHNYRDRFHLENNGVSKPSWALGESVTTARGNQDNDNDNDSLWYVNKTTDLAGLGTPFDVLPRYYKLAYILRWK